jgi:hypothetical protein
LNRLGKQQAESWELRKRDEVVKADDVLKREYGTRYAEKINLFTLGCNTAGPDVKQLLYRAGLGGKPGYYQGFHSLRADERGKRFAQRIGKPFRRIEINPYRRGVRVPKI